MELNGAETLLLSSDYYCYYYFCSCSFYCYCSCYCYSYSYYDYYNFLELLQKQIIGTGFTNWIITSVVVVKGSIKR